MKRFWVNLLLHGSRLAGGWFLRTVAYGVAGGYFLFRANRVRAGLGLYKALFPERGRAFHLYAVWRQFADFTAAYCDRLELEQGREILHTEEGWPFVKDAIEQGSGGIFLTAHFGNLEIAARLLKRKNLPTLLLMGERDPRQVARQQREAMVKEGLDILVSSSKEPSPFDGLKVLHHLREGGFLAMAGDLAWQARPRLVQAPFLGKTILLPETPHALALMTGVPLYTLWVFRTSRACYEVVVSKPRYVEAPSRKERGEAIRRSVYQYARELEAALRKHPWQWHVFEHVLQ
jgi:predicted LPLAT superfamily acyltransferase